MERVDKGAMVTMHFFVTMVTLTNGKDPLILFKVPKDFFSSD